MVDLYQRMPITAKADIWMLGCILFTLMFFRHPFQDAEALAIRNAKFEMPVSKQQFDPKLVDLIHWCLAKNPKQRPSAKQLVVLLQLASR